ncbi:LysE family translocator [Acinetobacter sp. P8-3-8]|uniref:LysE family translocator n=1 Tax=Acinetobacter sp. P8-3-8 TaxID=1029823 RepID=UPI0004963758|nr:LysE family transporter [Acinetobacter sp. P8-3-8]
MGEFIAVIMITILAVISPGADFAIVTKNSYLYGRKMGVFTSFGIALGVLVQVAYVLLAIAILFAYTPYIFNMMKYIGATYLIYIGYKTLIQKPIMDTSSGTNLSVVQALKFGFFTNALNPKTTLFIMSTYTQIVSLATPKIILIGYGLFMSFTHFLWFAAVSILFSTVSLRQKMLKQQVLMNRVIGTILCILGFSLLFINA